jgi:hypothetical protein
MRAVLTSHSADEEIKVLKDGITPCLTGNEMSSIHRMRDPLPFITATSGGDGYCGAESVCACAYSSSCRPSCESGLASESGFGSALTKVRYGGDNECCGSDEESEEDTAHGNGGHGLKNGTRRGRRRQPGRLQNREEVGLFVWPELGVKMEGSFRLKLSLYQIVRYVFFFFCVFPYFVGISCADDI